MKVKLIRQRKSECYMYQMEVGQLGRIMYGDQDHIILRTFSGVVSLTNPGDTWLNVDGVDIKVTILPKGTEVILEQ